MTARNPEELVYPRPLTGAEGAGASHNAHYAQPAVWLRVMRVMVAGGLTTRRRDVSAHCSVQRGCAPRKAYQGERQRAAPPAFHGAGPRGRHSHSGGVRVQRAAATHPCRRHHRSPRARVARPSRTPRPPAYGTSSGVRRAPSRDARSAAHPCQSGIPVRLLPHLSRRAKRAQGGRARRPGIPVCRIPTFERCSASPPIL